jgi:putative CocE/NonD family hydrolase
MNRVVRWRLGLPPPLYSELAREQDLPAVMSDGTVLLADRCFPAGHDGDLPTVLMRTPYGRRGLWAFEAGLLAECGYNVVVQSVRGTHGSGGTFEPFRNERADGAVAVAWVHEQPWFNGQLVTYGSSYCGITQHALADGVAPGLVHAMAPAVSAADVRGLFYPFGVFALASLGGWIRGLDPEGKRTFLDVLRFFATGRKARLQVAQTLPLSDVDVAMTGAEKSYFRDWLAHSPLDDDYWSVVDHRAGTVAQTAPVVMHSGWFDIFTPYQLQDFERMRAAGRDVELRIGPWNHGGGYKHRVLDAVSLFDHVCKDVPRNRPGRPLRTQLEGDSRWLCWEAWPPPATVVSWHLQLAGGLTQADPGPPGKRVWRSNPADPAPSCGGAGLHAGGSVDNAAREARPDVLVFTSDPLSDAIAVLGTPSVHLSVDSSIPHFDVVVRFCVVDSAGRSRNLSDGLRRVAPQPGVADDNGAGLVLDLWPVGVLLKPGERIRLQVASALHPLYARNLGSGEPAATARTPVPSVQTLRLGVGSPAYLALPVVEIGPACLAEGP